MEDKVVVGLQSWHDGGYCVLKNGEVVEHIEFERYTRIKESGGDAWKYFCDIYLKNNNISVDEAVKDFQFAAPMPSNTVHQSRGETFDVYKTLPKERVHFYSHHLCHTANSYFSSPYDNAFSISVDNAGMDNDEGLSLSCAIYVCQGNKMQRIFQLPSQVFSIGEIWGRLTRFVFKLSAGYPRGHQAGSVMAQAALGDPSKYMDDMKKMFGEDYAIASRTPNGMKRAVYVPPEEEVIHPYLQKYREIAENDQERYNIAASLQSLTNLFFEQIVMTAIQAGEKIGFNSKNFCFSGGASLNSVGLGHLWNRMPEDFSIFIPPVPYDGGLNIGAAQYHYHCTLGEPKFYDDTKFATPYLGEKYSYVNIMKVIEDNEDKITTCNSGTSHIAGLLALGKIISVFNGGSESGRRALGNRSILADPSRTDMKDMINDRVKHRQWYRPFAPAILEEYGDEWFEKFFPSPYMGLVMKIKPDKIGKAPAIEHFDGTGRVQSVNKKQNPWFYDVLSEFHVITKIPILLNTSFNDREPIVETPQNAIDCFLGTDIDYLYFADVGLLIEKKKNEE